jgi:hypothetical protein
MDRVRPYEKEGYTEKTGTGDGNAIVMGNEKYHNGFVLKSWETAYAAFNLGGKYSELSGMIGHIDGEGREDRIITIFGDGIELQQIKVGFLDLPKELKVNVLGVKQLKIEAAYGNSSHIGVAELKISSNPAAPKATPLLGGIVFMDEVRPYEKEGCTEKTGTGDGNAIVMGNEKYHNGFVLKSWGTAYAAFNLGGKYSELSGMIGHIDGEGREDRIITIFGDGEEIARIKVVFGDLPKEFKVSVLRVKQLKIEAAYGNNSHIGFAEIRAKQ